MWKEPKPTFVLSDEWINQFWNRSYQKNGCWIWTGGTSAYDKPVVYINYRTVAAQRVAYQLANGDLEANRNLVSSCGNTYCINPEHLELITKKHPDITRQTGTEKGVYLTTMRLEQLLPPPPQKRPIPFQLSIEEIFRRCLFRYQGKLESKLYELAHELTVLCTELAKERDAYRKVAQSSPKIDPDREAAELIRRGKQ